jgi:hypothetical protein
MIKIVITLYVLTACMLVNINEYVVPIQEGKLQLRIDATV